MIAAIDAYTVRHLDAWLDREIHGDACRAEVRAAMLGLVETDHVDGQRIRERHGRAQ